MATSGSGARANWLLLVLFTLGSLALAEVALRVLSPVALAAEHYPCIYVPDPIEGYRYRPNARGRLVRTGEIDNEVRTNDAGFHDRDHPATSAGRRIAVYGDSFTAALQVPVADGWTATLERALRERGWRGAEVANFGLDGSGTDVQRAILERTVDRFRPDLVLLAFYENDVGDVQAPRTFRECRDGYVLAYRDLEQRDQLRAFLAERRPGALRRAAVRHLHLLRFFEQRFGGGLALGNYLSPSRAGIPLREPSAPAGSFEAALSGFAGAAARAGVPWRLVPLPTKRDPAGGVEALRRALPEPVFASLPILDVRPALEALRARQGLSHEGLFWLHDAHLNAEGYRLLGLAVAEALDGPRRTP